MKLVKIPLPTFKKGGEKIPDLIPSSLPFIKGDSEGFCKGNKEIPPAPLYKRGG
jgi:hypothetical protein